MKAQELLGKQTRQKNSVTSQRDTVIARKRTAKDNSQPPSQTSVVISQQRRIPTRAFISMSFAPTLNDCYTFGIKQPLEIAGIDCERLDQVYYAGSIFQQIKARIRAADIVIAELTGNNPNVLLEIGFAYAIGKHVILLVAESSDIPSNLRDELHIIYHGSITNLHEQLTRSLAAFTQQQES